MYWSTRTSADKNVSHHRKNPGIAVSDSMLGRSLPDPGWVKQFTGQALLLLFPGFDQVGYSICSTLQVWTIYSYFCSQFHLVATKCDSELIRR